MHEPSWTRTYWRDRAMGGLVHLTYLVDFHPLRIELRYHWEADLQYGHWLQEAWLEVCCPAAPSTLLRRAPEGMARGAYFIDRQPMKPDLLTDTLEAWALASGLDPLQAAIQVSVASEFLLADGLAPLRGWPLDPPLEGFGPLPGFTYRDLVVPLTRVSP